MSQFMSYVHRSSEHHVHTWIVRLKPPPDGCRNSFFQDPVIDRRFDYKCEDSGAVTAGGLCGASAEQLLDQAYALTPVGSSQRSALSYIIQGQNRLLQNAVAFSEVPEGATITITAEEDADLIITSPSGSLASVLQGCRASGVRNIVPVCYIVGGLCSGKSSFLNTMLQCSLDSPRMQIRCLQSLGTEHSTRRSLLTTLTTMKGCSEAPGRTCRTWHALQCCSATPRDSTSL